MTSPPRIKVGARVANITMSTLSLAHALKRAASEPALPNHQQPKTLIVSQPLTRNVTTSGVLRDRNVQAFQSLAQYFVMTIRVVSYI